MLNQENRHLPHPGAHGARRDPELDTIVHKAGSVCRTSMALISFVDEHRRWSSAGVNIAGPHMPQLISFCTHALHGGRTTVVEDASRDLRLATNPLVKCPGGLRHYAGVPLRTAAGTRLGTLCVLDHHEPRALTTDQVGELERLAETIVAILEARRGQASASARQAAAA